MTIESKKKIILLSGSGDTVAWFRLDFLNEFLLRSYKVYVLAPDIRDDLKPELIDMGIEFIEITEIALIIQNHKKTFSFCFYESIFHLRE